jgi:hypothetical protein
MHACTDARTSTSAPRRRRRCSRTTARSSPRQSMRTCRPPSNNSHHAVIGAKATSTVRSTREDTPTALHYCEDRPSPTFPDCSHVFRDSIQHSSCHTASRRRTQRPGELSDASQRTGHRHSGALARRQCLLRACPARRASQSKGTPHADCDKLAVNPQKSRGECLKRHCVASRTDTRPVTTKYGTHCIVACTPCHPVAFHQLASSFDGSSKQAYEPPL